MSDTTPGGATRLPTGNPSGDDGSGASPAEREIAGYVRLVRAGLADLPPEDVEELTGGMEADLADMVADQGGRVRDHLGAPQIYAAELRRAAGLPPAAPTPGHRGPDEFYRSWQDSLARQRHASPAFDGAVDFLGSLRPTWWIVRGFTLAALLTVPLYVVGLGLGGIALWLLLGVVFAVVSVRRGRRTLRTGGSGLGALGDLALGVLTVLLGLLAFGSLLGTAGGGGTTDTSANPPPPGQMIGPDNLYVYDANGRRVPSARLFDSEGNPVELQSGLTPDPTTMPTDVYGAAQKNVVPMQIEGGGDPWADPHLEGAWTPPATIAPLVPAGGAAPSGTSSGTPAATRAPATPSPASTTPASPTPAATGSTTSGRPSSSTPATARP